MPRGTFAVRRYTHTAIHFSQVLGNNRQKSTCTRLSFSQVFFNLRGLDNVSTTNGLPRVKPGNKIAVCGYFFPNVLVLPQLPGNLGKIVE